MIAEASRRRIRVFLSSPSDVVAHRVRAGQIVLKLAREFSYHFDVEPVLWERQPLRATRHFQDEIIPPRQTDITVVVLWGKLGTALPEDQFSGAVSGKKPVTGTEWEFEDAFAGYQARQRPHLLVYRCLDRIPVDLNDEDAVVRGQAGKRQVEEFMRRWFLNDSDQTLKAAFHPFTTLTEFEEKLESNLRDLLRQEAGNALGEVTGIRWHESPYRGLGVFDVQHAPIFFGRTRARNELLQCLSQGIGAGTAFVFVTGASGCGKSSLVRAGLVPDLLAGEIIPNLGLCRYAIFKPSDAAHPAAALAESLFQPLALPELADLSYTTTGLAELLEQAPAQAVLPIRQGLEHAARKQALADRAIARLVLVVDQLEELFAPDSIDAAQREQFAHVLDVLARSGLVWVVATLRDDFWEQMATLPPLMEMADRRYHVPPISAAEFGQCIRQPAREAGLRFQRSELDGTSLDERVIAELRGCSELPLLQLLLDEIWKQRTDNGEMTFAAFESLGGLTGVIIRHAHEEFQRLPLEVQEVFPDVVRELVTVVPSFNGEIDFRVIGDRFFQTRSGYTTTTCRPASMQRFPSGTPKRQLVDAFLRPESRLLVAYCADDASPQIRFAHEALFMSWPLGCELIFMDHGALNIRARLERTARRWDSRGRSPDLLLPSGAQLQEAADLLRLYTSMLDDLTISYIKASQQARQRVISERVIFILVLIMMCAILILV